MALQEAQYSFTQWLGNILIIKLASFGELGLYTAAMQWNSIILFIPGVLQNVILSHLSETNKSESKHSRILKVSLIINLSATLIPALFVLLFSKFIGRLYGISFEGLNELVSISVFITIFSGMSNVYHQAYISKGLNWKLFVIRLFSAIFILVTFMFVLTYFKIEGARAMIYSSLIISVLTLLVMMIIYRRSLDSIDNKDLSQKKTDSYKLEFPGQFS
jgi:O-antigen/teichoic acid export membrane protein